MAVTEYKPINTLGCRYSYDKLENVVYLVSEEHVKDVHIDNGEAYITDLTEEPLRLEGFNIQFSEESSLDERYKFTKQVSFSLHGYVPFQDLNEKFYVILKSKDGTKWMVNVDFPSKVTYTFHLNGSQYQTDFTFSSVSNFPTLRLATDIDEGESPCKELRTFGIEKLKMLEYDYCRFERTSGTVHTYGHAFVDVDFLGQSCSLEESFDGEKVTTTIQFNIAFDAYKSSWHYNLLEFLKNRYSTIIKAKGTNITFFSGFNYGLQPSFNVSTTSQNGQSDIITVTLVETSLQGSTSRVTWSEVEETDTNWVYCRNVGIIQGWECVGLGVARYLLQQEINQLGEPTGRYKAYSGYTGYFPTLNIVGEFTEEMRFSNSECTEAICQVNTNIPITIVYNAPTCYTYSYSASCDWDVSGLASYMTVTPSSGNGGTAYTLSVCNSKTPTVNESSTFNITSGNNTRIVNVNLTTDAGILNPSSVNITCLQQNVPFTFNQSCPITVTNIDPRLTYQITNNQLIVNVPRNYSIESGITWPISVKDCNNNTQTVTINQDKTYEMWVDTTGFMCSGSTSYVKQQRYTGTTSSNINTATQEYRMGAKIADNDSRCGSYETRWTVSTAYTCVDGDKWSIEEEEIKYEGGTWQKTGNTRLKEMVESASSFCSDTVEYKWVLTDRWQCYQPFEGKFLAYYSDSTSYSAACNASSWLRTTDTKAHSTSYTAMTSAEIGSCITGMSNYVFSDCKSLTSVTIPSSVASIGDSAFNGCRSLTSVTIPSRVASIGSGAFAGCRSLTSIAIPNRVTSIGVGVFDSCTSLTSVTMPNSITSIRDTAFANCTSLTSVTIPNSVTNINDQAFAGCSGLTSVVIGSGVTSIGNWTFGFCSSLTSITIPDSVTSIDNYAFDTCSGLTSVVIGSGITSIGEGAFQFCGNLTLIIIEATTPPTLDYYAFYRTNDCPIYVPRNSVNLYQSATNWSAYASRIYALPNS